MSRVHGKIIRRRLLDQQINRRSVLLASALPLARAASSLGTPRGFAGAQTPETLRTSGIEVPELVGFDQAAAEFVRPWRWRMPFSRCWICNRHPG
ncbi:MAG: hypothetical protein KC438_09015, partial [Thermomicrobiales bacterium]|nr:hypothetical protein [Thermomicrobiales bacterium]